MGLIWAKAKFFLGHLVCHHQKGGNCWPFPCVRFDDVKHKCVSPNILVLIIILEFVLWLVKKVGWEQWLRTELERSDEVPETVSKTAMLQV